MRERLGVYDRPFTFTALKPMGLPPEALAEEAYRCALGGIDLIKDDHGLMDQPFAPFRERVERAAGPMRRQAVIPPTSPMCPVPSAAWTTASGWLLTAAAAV